MGRLVSLVAVHTLLSGEVAEPAVKAVLVGRCT
jgi:hypothetical protein